ncbi:MAG: CpaF family protein [Candidatus Margulisiibacteriota bacterium]|jgi:pilus assembly protein CpaF
MSLLDRIKPAIPDKPEAKAEQQESPVSAPAEPGALAEAEAVPAGLDEKAKRQKKIFLDNVLRIHKKLINDSDLDLKEADLQTTNDREIDNLKNKVRQSVTKIIEEGNFGTSRTDRNDLIQAVLDETLGLGPIESLIKDDTITEIMVNGPDQVYVEQKGKLILTKVIFFNDQHVRRIIEKIVGQVGRRIDEGMPMVDARLKDGSRVNAVIPPVSLVGPVLTIRKFSDVPFNEHDLVNFGSMNDQMCDFLRACVKSRLNIIVSGGTGSGKTTLLNVLSSFIPADERIVTIEDSAELQLHQDHVITMESRPANIEGSGEISIRDLVRNSLRMRPERIVVGEVRGGEALDMLQAMNTGHDGSMTTGHANTPRDMVARIETMVLMAGMDLPSKAIRQQVAAAFDMIIQQSRLSDGTRKVTNITEVVGMEGDTVTLQDIFIYEQKGVDPATGKVIGEFKPTGIRPKFSHKMETHGVDVPWELFTQDDGVFKKFKF